jgi:aspartate/methionine/tyrosine aminotransferase
VPVYVPTEFPDFRLDLDRLAAAVTDRTRVIVVNTPTNPTGQLLSAEEIRRSASWPPGTTRTSLDEVYEHLVYDGAEHLPVASDPVARERTITVSSVSKTFSATGWRIGWAVAPRSLSAAVRSAHQFVTFNATTPLQRATAVMLDVAATGGYYRTLVGAVHRAAGHPARRAGRARPGDRPAAGDILRMTRCAGDDTAYVKDLIASRGVAAIPGSPSTTTAGRVLAAAW